MHAPNSICCNHFHSFRSFAYSFPSSRLHAVASLSIATRAARRDTRRIPLPRRVLHAAQRTNSSVDNISHCFFVFDIIFYSFATFVSFFSSVFASACRFHSIFGVFVCVCSADGGRPCVSACACITLFLFSLSVPARALFSLSSLLRCVYFAYFPQSTFARTWNFSRFFVPILYCFCWLCVSFFVGRLLIFVCGERS